MKILESFKLLNNEIQNLRELILSSSSTSIDKKVLINKSGKKYIIEIAEEIKRVLITKKGSIPMNPEYGSELYKLRDRTLDDEIRLKIISFTFEAIDKWVDRVKCKRVDVIALDDKKFNLRIEIDPA